MKILWKSEKIHENPWKSYENLTKIYDSTTVAMNGAWEIPRTIYEASQQHWTAHGEFPAQFTKHHSSTAGAVNGAWEIPRTIYKAPQQHWTARGKFPAKFTKTSDTFNRVECIRLSSDFWYIRPNVWDFRQIWWKSYENHRKSMKIYENLMKIWRKSMTAPQ